MGYRISRSGIEGERSSVETGSSDLYTPNMGGTSGDPIAGGLVPDSLRGPHI